MTVNYSVTHFTSGPNQRSNFTEPAPLAYQKGLENWYGSPAFVLNPDVQYQEFLGFGGSMTESAWYALSQLSEEKREEVTRSYYCSNTGNGYRFTRTHINSCDFSLENWACVAQEGDTELSTFSFERTKRFLLPLLTSAKKYCGDDIRLIASPWSPPAWMKTNGQMNGGGQLLPRYREAWANYYLKWIDALQKCGFPTWAITVQNEPEATQVWDSCIYSAEEERDFIRDYLGPTLMQSEHSRVKIIGWDHNRERAFERGRALYEDAEAAKYVWGLGLHWYSGDYFEQLKQLSELYPDKAIVFTEGCCEGGVKIDDWSRGQRYAHHIIGDLNHNCRVWCDWNLALDERGGPNHVGNFCDSPIIVSRETGEFHCQPSFYAIGHFSRFIKTGARRIGVSYFGGSLEATAFENPDKSITFVVLNPASEQITFRLLLDGGGVESLIGPYELQSYVLRPNAS